MKKLYFLRHGESENNVKDLWNEPHTPLTARGQMQARTAGAHAHEQGLAFDIIVSSPLPRALETARLVAQEIGYPLEAIIIDELFVEREMGTLAGQPKPPLHAVAERAVIDKESSVEGIENLQRRAARGLELLKTRPEPTVLLVGHAASGRALLRVINNQPHDHEFDPSKVKLIVNGEIMRFI